MIFGQFPWLPNVFAVVMGLMIGSFLNVVIARLPRRKSLVRPRSRCPRCHRMITWYDNIPLLSYIALRGRCRGCGAPISIRYPMVEALTALLFLATMVRFGPSWALILRDWPFVAILIAVTFIDLQLRIIPDPLSLGGLALGLATCWMVSEPGWKASLIGAAVGFGVFYALAAIYEKVTGRIGLGGGDIKLLAMLGAFIGPGGVLVAILISSLAGSAVGLTWGLVKGRDQLMKLAIPYGPFLVVGGLYYYLIGDLVFPRFFY